jgi:hypothetical protein
MDQEASSKAKKSRLRVPTVCTVCRRRKMKCDKARPHCTSCVKNRTTHLCHYEEQPWASDNEIQKLKEQVFALQQQNNELKNLLNKRTLFTPVQNQNEGLIIPDEPGSDPILQLTKDFDLIMLKENKISHYGSSSYMAVVSQDPVLRQMFKKHIDLQSMGINFNKFFLYDQGVLPLLNDSCGILNPSDSNTTSVFEKDSNKSNKTLVDSINSILPQKEILIALLDHFFAEAYAFVPFIDETAFRKNVESVISMTSSGKAILVLSNVTQFTTVALLLAVLRFSFISLPLKKFHASHSIVMQSILDSNVSIPPSFIEYAKACIASASVLRKPTLKHIQALLMLRLYRFYAPEDGDESTDSTIFLALIVQMAKMHGLHRDPARFSIVKDHGTTLLWKKIWIQLMYLDAVQSLQFGCPLLIDDEYDTELPVPTSADSALEKNCIEGLIKLNEVTQLIRGLLKESQKIRDLPKRSDLERLLNNVEFTILKYRTISDLTDLSSPLETFLTRTSKIKELTLKLMLYNLHSVFSYILLLTCDGGEISAIQKYSASTAESSFIVFRLCHDYSRDLARYNETLNFESFLSASVFEMSKRVMQQVTSFCIRDLCGMFNLERVMDSCNTFPDSKGMMEWLSPFSPDLTYGDQVIIRIEEYIQHCSKLSHRYFICWRLIFINKLFEDYVDVHYPGKFQNLQIAIENFNQAEQSQKIDLNISEMLRASEILQGSTSHVGEIWNQLVDDAPDYLDPKFNKFDEIGDPFFSTTGFYDNASELTFQDFDNLINVNAEAGFLGIPRDSVTTVDSATDEVSPRTESSGQIVKNVQEGQNSSSKVLINDELGEADLAFDIARSMFGGSTDLFSNDMT